MPPIAGGEIIHRLIPSVYDLSLNFLPHTGRQAFRLPPAVALTAEVHLDRFATDFIFVVIHIFLSVAPSRAFCFLDYYIAVTVPTLFFDYVTPKTP